MELLLGKFFVLFKYLVLINLRAISFLRHHQNYGERKLSDNRIYFLMNADIKENKG